MELYECPPINQHLRLAPAIKCLGIVFNLCVINATFTFSLEQSNQNTLKITTDILAHVDFEVTTESFRGESRLKQINTFTVNIACSVL